MAEHLDTLFVRLGADNADAEFAFAVHSYHFQFHMRIAEYSGCAGLREMIRKNNVLVFNWLNTGEYSTIALAWFCMGALDRLWTRTVAADASLVPAGVVNA